MIGFGHERSFASWQVDQAKTTPEAVILASRPNVELTPQHLSALNSVTGQVRVLVLLSGTSATQMLASSVVLHK